MAQSVYYQKEKLGTLDKISDLLNEIIEQQQCFSLKDLAVNGKDLLAVGFEEGVEIGAALNRLIEMVIDEQVENDKHELLRIAEKLCF